jgi:hypothetical protein
MVMRTLPRLRRSFPLAVAVLVLVACGGEGGDEGGGGNPTLDPSALTVSPGVIGFEIIENDARSAGAKTLQVSVNHPQAAFIGAGFPTGTPPPTWLTPIELDGAATEWTVTVRTSSDALPAGTYRTTVRVGVARQDQSVIGYRDVPVTYTVRPGIGLNENAMSFAHVLGSPAPSARVVYLFGTDGLWTAAASAAWIVVDPSGSTNEFVQIAVDPTGLEAGTYTGTVTFTAADATAVSTVTLTIT